MQSRRIDDGFGRPGIQPEHLGRRGFHALRTEIDEAVAAAVDLALAALVPARQSPSCSSHTFPCRPEPRSGHGFSIAGQCCGHGPSARGRTGQTARSCRCRSRPRHAWRRCRADEEPCAPHEFGAFAERQATDQGSVHRRPLRPRPAPHTRARCPPGRPTARPRSRARAASRSSRPSRRAAIACNGTSDTDAGRPAACRRGSPAIRPATRRSARAAPDRRRCRARRPRTPARCRSRGERQRADHRMRGFVVIDRDPVQHHPREPRHAVRIDEADPLAAREPAVEARPVGSAPRTRDRSDATSTARRAAARGNPRVARRRSRAARPDCARARLRCRETPACRSALQASGPSANGRAASSAAHRRYGAARQRGWFWAGGQKKTGPRRVCLAG